MNSGVDGRFQIRCLTSKRTLSSLENEIVGCGVWGLVVIIMAMQVPNQFGLGGKRAHGDRLSREAEGGTIRTCCKQHTPQESPMESHQPSFCCSSSHGSLRLLSVFGRVVVVVVVVALDGWMDG